LELDLARFLLPGLTILTAVKTLMVLFQEQARLALLRFRGGHVVICGLSRKGYLLATGYLERGKRVVVIEQDTENDLVESCRSLGAMVLIGDATQPGILARSRVQTAQVLYAVSDDDGTNVEIALCARQVNGKRSGGTLAVVLHLVDPLLCNLLREREFDTTPDTGFHLRLFNVYDHGARLILKEFSPFTRHPNGQTPPHILVVGMGKFGESLIVQAGMHWKAHGWVAGARMRMTVVDQEAVRKLASLRARFPLLEDLCEVTVCPMDVRSVDFQQARFLDGLSSRREVDAIYICLDQDTLALTAGLALHQHLRTDHIPIVIRMTESAWLAGLLRHDAREADPFENLHAFCLLDRTCNPDLLEESVPERIARAIHEHYRTGLPGWVAGGQPNPDSLPTWDELPEDLKESNRRQAADLGYLLGKVGYRIGMLTDWKNGGLRLTPAEIEQVACTEHTRYVQERLRAGWRPGPKDLKRKTHPALVPWDQLPLADQEKTREMMRSLPAILAAANLQIFKARVGEEPALAGPADPGHAPQADPAGIRGEVRDEIR